MSIQLSIIIINYNTSVLTFNCVKSIFKNVQTNLNFEIIVVDNGSKYQDYLSLKENIKTLNSSNLKLIRSKSNTGFSSGNMYGVQEANGSFLAFVNNDVIFIEDSFSFSINYLEENSDVGVIGLQPIFENEKKQIAFGHFDTFLNRLLGYWLYEKIFFKKYKRHENYSVPIEVDFVVGSFMLFKSDVFFKINGFDTNIFLYFEEMDICKRLKLINLKTVFIPFKNYIHLNGMSTNLGYLKKIEIKISHLYVVRKNHGYFSYVLLKYFFIIIFIFKSIFNPKHFKMLYRLITMGSPLAKSIRHQQIIQKQ